MQSKPSIKCSGLKPEKLLRLRGRIKLTGTMRAARGAFLDLFQAKRARGHGRGRLFFLARQLLADVLRLVHGLHQHKHHERHNEEVNARADERAEVDVGAGYHQTGNGIGATTCDYGNQRIDDVRGQRRHNGRERTADDNANGQVHNIAAIDELLELGEKLLHPQTPFFPDGATQTHLANNARKRQQAPNRNVTCVAFNANGAIVAGAWPEGQQQRASTEDVFCGFLRISGHSPHTPPLSSLTI